MKLEDDIAFFPNTSIGLDLWISFRYTMAPVSTADHGVSIVQGRFIPERSRSSTVENLALVHPES